MTFLISIVSAYQMSSWVRDDLYPIDVSISNPVNNSFVAVSDVDLNWSVQTGADNCSYSLDGGAENYSLYFKNWTDMQLCGGACAVFSSGEGFNIKTSPEMLYYQGDFYYFRERGTGGPFSVVQTHKYNTATNNWDSYPAFDFQVDGNNRDFGDADVFYMNDNLYAIYVINTDVGSQDNLYGFYFNGSKFISDNTTIQGISTTSLDNLTSVEVFVYDDEYYLLSSGATNTGYKWNGSDWEVNTSFDSGFPANAYEKMIYERFGELYMLVGRQPLSSDTSIEGFKWNGTDWTSHTISNVALSGTFSSPSVSGIFGELHFHIGGDGSVSNNHWNETATITKSDTILGGLSEGSHYVTLTCDDYSVRSDFIIDTTNPLISYGSEVEANDSSIYERDWIFVNVSVTESNEDTIKFFLLDDTGAILSTSNHTDSTRSVNFTSLTDGTYRYYVWINDSLGNTNQTAQRTINVFNNPQDFYPLFEGEIVYTGEERGLYQVLRGFGAGLGRFLEILGITLPVLLILLAVVGIVVAVGFAIPIALKKFKFK
jgi:hypothetical protein